MINSARKASKEAGQRQAQVRQGVQASLDSAASLVLEDRGEQRLHSHRGRAVLEGAVVSIQPILKRFSSKLLFSVIRAIY
jgi:hypothetical protein